MTTSEKEWARHVRAWRASGETAAEYCESRGLKLGSLRYWSARLGRNLDDGEPGRGESGRGVRLARVQVRSEQEEPLGSGVCVRVGTLAVEIEAGFDAATLTQVLEVLQTVAGDAAEQGA